MDNAASARQRFTWGEQARVKDWLRKDHIREVAFKAWHAVVGGMPHVDPGRPVAPIDREIAMAAAWHRTGLLVPFADDPMQVYLRAVAMPDEDSGHGWTFMAYPVGRCPRCEAPAVPIGDGATDADGFIEAVAVGQPASGHVEVCPGLAW